MYFIINHRKSSVSIFLTLQITKCHTTMGATKNYSIFPKYGLPQAKLLYAMAKSQTVPGCWKPFRRRTTIISAITGITKWIELEKTFRASYTLYLFWDGFRYISSFMKSNLMMDRSLQWCLITLRFFLLSLREPWFLLRWRDINETFMKHDSVIQLYLARPKWQIMWNRAKCSFIELWWTNKKW